MDYHYENGDEDALIARLGPHFTPHVDPMDVQFDLQRDPVWDYVRPALRLAGSRLLRLELDEDERSTAQVTLNEIQPFGERNARLERPSGEERRLWTSVASHPRVPASLEVIVRDLLLSTGADATPQNAERVVDGYRAVAQGPGNNLHVALAISRANTIARSRSMPVEALIRAEALTLAERVLTDDILPGISLRHAGVVAESPRVGVRAPDELTRLTAVLDRIESAYFDESTLEWIVRYRVAVASTEAERNAARRRHVEQFITISVNDSVPFRAMLWAEKAVALATKYGLQDLHDKAVVRMQKLSRTDLGWRHHVQEITVPAAMFRQRQRRVAKLSSWEQALAMFLADDSPTGSMEKLQQKASNRRPGILDLVSGRTFGSHQLPERTHGASDEEHLAQLVQITLGHSSTTLRVDLDAIAARFGIADEDEIIAHVSTIYDSAPGLVRPFAQALRLYWGGDPSGAARLAIPLVETGARELLFLMDQPLYRMERGATPGRFPAMDFYVDKLEELGLDVDWVTALRGTLLGAGMNLRNRFAHGFQLDFTAGEAALLLRLAGLFIAMPVGTDAIDDERVRTPLAVPRKRLRRSLAWAWR